MAIATMPASIIEQASLLTYDQLLAEPASMERYDIVDGVKIVSNPTAEHQDILLNLGELLRAYQRAARKGRVYVAPRDVMIRRNPLRTRQPDVLFISNELLAQSPPRRSAEALPAGPELAVEILSPSETRRSRADKIKDYQSVGVKECWIVSSQAETVEVLRLTPDAVETVAVYGSGQTLVSAVFPDLTANVDSVFAE